MNSNNWYMRNKFLTHLSGSRNEKAGENEFSPAFSFLLPQPFSLAERRVKCIFHTDESKIYFSTQFSRSKETVWN